MNTQQDLDKWINNCIKFYNKNSLTKIEGMKTTEEKVTQLENAFSRLHNSQKDILEKYEQLQSKLIEEINKLNSQLKAFKAEVPDDLPEHLVEHKKYNAIITEIISQKDVIYRNMAYTNWEVRLKGKEHIFLIFSKREINYTPGTLIQFQYKNYLKLMHTKVL